MREHPIPIAARREAAVSVNSGLSGALERREDRQLARRLAALERDRAYGFAEVQTRAELQASRAHAVAYVGEQGMQAVAMLSQLEAQLGQICPMAVTRLQGIADMTSVGIAQVVANAVREVSE